MLSGQPTHAGYTVQADEHGHEVNPTCIVQLRVTASRGVEELAHQAPQPDARAGVLWFFMRKVCPDAAP